MGHLTSIAIHPIKSLDRHARDRVTISSTGGLSGDRTYAIVDSDGDYVNGKRTAAVHRLRATLDREGSRLELGVDGEDSTHTFHVENDRHALNEWLSEYFGYPVELDKREDRELTDIPDPGPTVIARATLETAADWFPGIDADELADRLRPNLIVDGVEAFWADRLVPDGRVRIGEMILEGSRPVPRCVVPTRDPRTGEVYEGFRETFIRNRKETFPDWADLSAFDTYFSLMTATHVPEASRGVALSIGDTVELLEPQTH